MRVFNIRTAFVLIFILLPLIIGLEAVTFCSQWNPIKGLYKDRDVEGMYLLLEVPKLDRQAIEMSPKALVQGCREVLLKLKGRLLTHYALGKHRTEWSSWIDDNLPDEGEDASKYIKNHDYYCPLISYFRGIQHRPSWRAPAPSCSPSIFPKHRVLQTASVQWAQDHQGPATPHIAIDNAIEVGEVISVESRYACYRVSENARLALCQGKRLKEIINHKVKQNGSRYPSSGSIKHLCAIIFECDINFFSSR